MNIRAIKWLITHRELLTKVVAAAQKFNRDGTYISQWEVVDEIARLVLPVFEQEGVAAYELLEYDYDEEYAAFTTGAEVAAMGVDWKQLLDVVLPILLAILKALASNG